MIKEKNPVCECFNINIMVPSWKNQIRFNFIKTYKKKNTIYTIYSILLDSSYYSCTIYSSSVYVCVLI